MSTDLQKTMQKVQLVSPEGVIFRPRNRVLCLLDSIAGHTHHEAPHRGVCLSRETLGKHGMNKSKETVSLAAKEAESCGLIRRASVKPKRITLQPQGKRLTGKWAKGELELTIPQVDIHTVLVIE